MSKETDTVLMNSPFKGVDNIREVYFIGIGGIGMSAIARFFHSKGVKVSGYDKTPTVLTKELEASGIDIHYKEDLDLIPKDAQLVVYTPAVPRDHKELVYYQQHGNPGPHNRARDWPGQMAAQLFQSVPKIFCLHKNHLLQQLCC